MSYHPAIGSGYRVEDEYAREYLSRNEGVTLKPSSAESYDSILTRYVAFLEEHSESVLSTEFELFRQFIESYVRKGNRRSSLESKVTAIAEMYRYIRLRTDVGMELTIDPLEFRDFDLDQYNTPPPIERKDVSREELRRLFDVVESYRDRLMLVVGIETGGRNSDIRGIRLEDASVENEVIHFQDPKGSRPYDVPISRALVQELEFWCQHHRGAYTAAKDAGYLFPSQQGGKLETNGSLNRIVTKAAEDAGIQGVIASTPLSEADKERLNTDKEYLEWNRVTMHTLRHSYITLLKDSGVGIHYRQLVANHADPSTTRGYTHGRNRDLEIIRQKYDPPW